MCKNALKTTQKNVKHIFNNSPGIKLNCKGIRMDKLNQYVLMEIFQYLDGKSLKSCAQTCSSWAKMIGTSISTMKKLPLKIDKESIGENNCKMKDLKRLQRIYYAMIIDEMRMTCTLLKNIKSVITHIRFLELTEVSQNMASWKNLLKSLNHIEKIIIMESSLSAIRKDVVSEKIAVPSLKSLVFIDSDWSYFANINETGLEELKIHNRCFFPEDVLYFYPFLKEQKNLVSLGVRVQDKLFYKMLLNDEDHTHKFRLKNLSFVYRNANDTVFGGMLLDLLVQHKESLEHLEVNNKLNENYFKFIFTDMKLKSIVLNAGYLPQENNVFYSSLKPNHYLKKLVLTGELSSQIVAQGIFHVYRSVEDLTIQDWSTGMAQEILINVINSLTKCASLKIPFLVENTTELPMTSLKNLLIDSVKSKIELGTFLHNQVNLEKLSIKWIHDDINAVLEEESSRLKKLKHISFGFRFDPTITTLQTLKRNCPNLSILEMFHDFDKAVSPDILDTMKNCGLKVVQFKNNDAANIFPIMKGMWYEEEKLYTTLSYTVHSSSDRSLDDSDDDFDDDDDDDFDDYDSDFGMGGPFHYYGDSDSDDFEDYVMREVINFLIH